MSLAKLMIVYINVSGFSTLLITLCTFYFALFESSYFAQNLFPLEIFLWIAHVLTVGLIYFCRGGHV